MTTYYVYQHVSPTGKSYVGFTSSKPTRRWLGGKGYKKNPDFYADIQRFGWEAFEHRILLETSSETEAASLEKRLIREYDLLDPSNGYNLRGGDNGGFSKQSSKRMSEARIGNTNCVGRSVPPETRRLISSSLRDYYSRHDNPFLGKTHSAATRKKISERVRASHCGRRAVEQMTMTGEHVARFDSISEAAAKTGVDASAISKCCREKLRSSGGFRWNYIEG